VKIFLSFASPDRPTAERIHYALRGAGHEVFFDKASLPPGADYNSRIRREIDGCDLFICLISPHFVGNKRYVKSELKIAKQKWPTPWGNVLPVLISATDPKLIDPYVAAATLLEPEGDVAAEVVVATLSLPASQIGVLGGTPGTIAIQQHTTRIGVISPNLLLNIDDFNQMFEDKGIQLPFETVAKRVAFLFDKIFVSDDLKLTYEVIGSCSGDFDDDPTVKTLRFLHKKGFVVEPKDLGIPRVNAFIARNPDNLSARLHRELLRIGNPGIEDFQRELLIGQPDVGWFAANNGWHPRRDSIDKLGMTIEQQQLLYENLLIRRNMALLRELGYQDSVVAGQLYEHTADTPTTSVVWRIVIAEMPQLSLKVPWKDVLDFRKEEQTQQLSRSLRRWVRKTVSENLSAAQVEDEVRSLLSEYEKHMKISGMKADRAALEFLIPHDAHVDKEMVEETFIRFSDLATITRSRRLELLEAEMKAPGRELALIPKLRKRFGDRRRPGATS
jgi:hypothetical protein